jgi:hypothetical protein
VRLTLSAEFAGLRLKVCTTGIERLPYLEHEDCICSICRKSKLRPVKSTTDQAF